MSVALLSVAAVADNCNLVLRWKPRGDTKASVGATKMQPTRTTKMIAGGNKDIILVIVAAVVLYSTNSDVRARDGCDACVRCCALLLLLFWSLVLVYISATCALLLLLASSPLM